MTTATNVVQYNSYKFLLYKNLANSLTMHPNLNLINILLHGTETCR